MSRFKVVVYTSDYDFKILDKLDGVIEVVSGAKLYRLVQDGVVSRIDIEPLQISLKNKRVEKNVGGRNNIFYDGCYVNEKGVNCKIKLLHEQARNEQNQGAICILNSDFELGRCLTPRK